MAAIPYVLSAEPYYKAFHENLLAWGKTHPPVVADQFVCIKADFRSQHAQRLRPDDQDEAENVAFALPLVLPRQPGPFERVIIILHGLNESEYRKFFPWACTLASAGFPVALFPITFLVNRRPRRWMSNAETQRCLRERQAIPGNTVATRYNTILSERLDSPSRAAVSRGPAELRRSPRSGCKSAPRHTDGGGWPGWHAGAAATICHGHSGRFSRLFDWGLPDPGPVVGRRRHARFVEKPSRDLRRWSAFFTR